MSKPSPQMPETLKERHAAYISQLKEHGVPLVEYNCPECDYVIETPRNDTHGNWGSIVCCPHCEQYHYKTTAPNGGEVKVVSQRGSVI